MLESFSTQRPDPALNLWTLPRRARSMDRLHSGLARDIRQVRSRISRLESPNLVAQMIATAPSEQPTLGSFFLSQSIS